MLIARLIAVTALMTGAAAAQEPAQDPEGPAITVTGDKPEPKPKLVCKNTTTGTYLRKRVCMPASEWAKAERNSAETLKAMRDWQRVRCGFGSIC